MSDDLEAGGHHAITHEGETYIKLADASVTFSLYRKDIALKDAEIARLRATLATANTWRDTINSRLTSWMHPVLDGEEPHDALMRLLDFERRAFCDPAVSQAAADLVAASRREGMEEAAKRLEELHKNHGYDAKTGEVRRRGELVTCPLTIDHAIGYYRALAEGAAHILRAAEKEGK